MSFMKLTSGQTRDAALRDSLLRGAAILTAAFHKPNHQAIQRFAPKDKIATWWTLDNPVIAMPLGCSVSTIADAIIDTRTLDADKLCFFGGYILGGFDSIDLPLVNTDDAATVLCDFIACSFLLAMKEQYAMSYAMQQASFQLMSLYTRRVLEKPSASAFMTGVKPYGL